MSFRLSSYWKKPGLDLEEHRPALEALVGHAREILPRYEAGREGFRPPYNPHDFSFTDLEAETAPARLRGKPLQIGRKLAREVAVCLGWDRRTNPDVLNSLGWTFFYFQSDGFEGKPNMTEEFHTDGFDDGINDPSTFGLWVPSSEIAPFQVIARQGQEGFAYAAYGFDLPSPPEMASLGQAPGNEVRSLDGNLCVELPEIMPHRRKPIDLTKIQSGERFAFRISWFR